jgi:peptidoglycan/xylan/chitin deacetylase (PgdA/CDA1 family)
MYHSVTEVPTASTRALSVTPATFAAQLNYLRRQGFTGLTFGELCTRRRTGQPLPPRPIVLTFDDGYADFVDDALPLMLERGYPATVFVTTGWLRDAGSIATGTPPDRMMSWAQLSELAAAGVELGAHSHSHAQLDQLSLPRLHAELTGSKHMLEDHLGQSIESLAYPYGYSTKRVREASREVGYLQAAYVGNAMAPPACDPFRVPRLTIRRSTSSKAFAGTANGKGVRRRYATAHMLTAGWALARRARSVARSQAARAESTHAIR